MRYLLDLFMYNFYSGMDLRMKNCYCEDDDIPGLLMFCLCTCLVKSVLYSESLLILQDKVHK